MAGAPFERRQKKVYAFVMPDGLHCRMVLPFGMKNVPATIQRLMNKVKAGINVVNYLEHIVVHSCLWSEHVEAHEGIVGTLTWSPVGS